jgi:hypothetical protein
MGVGFDSLDPAAPVTAPFAAWVHATVDYDPDIDKFIIFYNINSGHSISTNRVLLTKKAPDGPFDTPVIVADNATTESAKTQAAGIAPNGDYLALVGVFNWGNSTPIRTDIYRSTTKGATWTITTMVDSADSSPIIAFNGDVSGFLKLASGRILTMAVEPAPSYLARVFYSDDNGATWSKASIAGAPTDVTEPGWVELPDGSIVCMARAAVRSGSTTTKIPAKFMTSFDAGATWSEPVDSTSILDFTLSNGQMLIDENSQTVEFIHHSRFAQPDGFTSFYVASASFDDAKTDNFGAQIRIGKLAAYVPIGGSSGDSGYVGAAKSSTGVINAFYYNGLRNAAQINWAVGRQRAAQEREYFINPVTGQPDGGGSIAGGYATKLYAGKLESYQVPGSVLSEGYIEGTGRYRKNEGSVRLYLTGQGRAAAKPVVGIDLTDIDEFYTFYDGEALPGTVDFAIYLYDKADPAGSSDGRVRFEASQELGNNTIRMDVSDLSGVYYPQLMLSQNSGTLTGQARIIEFGFTSSKASYGDPSEAGPDFMLYHRGNQRPYLSGATGWKTGFSTGTTIDVKEDRIVLLADGSSGINKLMATTSGAIDFSGIDAIELLANVSITNDAKSDFGVAVFDSDSPATETTGRQAFKFIKETGLVKVVLDVQALTSGYVAVVANANTAGSAASVVTVDMFEVKMY